MIMTAVAKVVWRSADGSMVHYLSSTPEGSDLIFTSPAYGVVKEHLDGLCRQTDRASGHMYESISATGSTLITPTTTGMLIREYGHCMSCFLGPHDYELWPVCPSGDRGKKADRKVVPLRSEPAPEPVPASSQCTVAEPSAPAEGKAKVGLLDPQYTPAPVEPVTPPEIRWGPGPGASW
jgi:hypothetical protein